MRATKENILQYLEEIKKEFANEGITTFALFGSYAKNTQTVYSDIDIAIAKDKSFLVQNSSYAYFDIVAKLKEKIGKNFHKNIDIFDLDCVSPLKKSIQSELIYV